MNAQVMDQDGSNNDKEGRWRMWTRSKPNRKTAITRLDRVSRPRALFLMRPLTKIGVRAIPKSVLANLLGTLAPTPEMAELATHRYDIAGNCIQITLYDQEPANRLVATTSLSFTTTNLSQFLLKSSTLPTAPTLHVELSQWNLRTQMRRF